MTASQQERTDWEKNLPELARAQLDHERSRPKTADDCYRKLEVVEAMLKRLLEK